LKRKKKIKQKSGKTRKIVGGKYIKEKATVNIGRA